MRKQRAFLRDIADAAAFRRAVQAGAGDRLAMQRDLAGIRPLEAGDQAEQRRLAAAGGAEDGDQLAGADVEVDIVQHLLVAEALGDAREGERAHGASGANRVAAPNRRANSQEARREMTVSTAA